MTPADLVSKIDYEGGVYEAVCGYGLTEGDLTGASIVQKRAWAAVVEAGRQMKQAVVVFEQVFPEVEAE